MLMRINPTNPDASPLALEVPPPPPPPLSGKVIVKVCMYGKEGQLHCKQKNLDNDSAHVHLAENQNLKSVV